ncbi:MAG TPA: alpha/beta hydrolase [Acidimicrobiia bacterium]|nr:alpha/beta hydrolase [Acidimicrobiia bacterium]
MEQVFPCVENMEAAEARAMAKEMPPAVEEPEAVAVVYDRTIPGPDGDVPVRVYRPVEGGDPLPVVVYFHGGGWVICDLDTHDGTCRALANGVNAVVVSVDYRLAPEHKFPAAAEDAYEVTSWVAAHADELGVEPSRLAVAGDSAGGNLAAVVALMARDRGGPAITFQLLVYPVTNHSFDTDSYRENADGYFLHRASMEWYWRQYLADERDGANPYASPLRVEDARGLPPGMVITAEFDPLRDEGEAYGRKLAEAGVPFDVRRYDGVFHGFFSMVAFLDGAKQATADAHAALRDALWS